MLDASVLAQAVLAGKNDVNGLARWEADDIVAPHVIDVEVLGVVRDHLIRGEVDETRAAMAIERLRAWPGERFGHQPLIERAWELRHNVRVWDAMYVALAEAFACPLITRDARLARAVGPRCEIELIS